MANATIEVKGLDIALKGIEKVDKALSGPEMLSVMRRATLVVTGDAKRLTPVDTGRLRASITPSVAQMGDMVEGVVGSNVKYAPWVELGTKPHWPPIAALEVWARRHGTEAFLVARAIAKRGTKAHKFLEQAMLQNRERILQMFDAAVQKLVNG